MSRDARQGVFSMTLFQGKYRIETARHANQDYASPGWYFVTICTARRKCFFGKIREGVLLHGKMGDQVARQWQGIAGLRNSVKLDEFVVMPNHLHGIVVIEGEHRLSPPRLNDVESFRAPLDRRLKPTSLGSIVGSFKAGFTAWCRKNGYVEFGWQPRYYDKIIRSNTALEGIREYIRQNPLNWKEDEFYVEEETP